MARKDHPIGPSRGSSRPATKGMSSRKLLGQVTQTDRTNPSIGFDLIETSITDEVFGDGVQQAIIGPFITRMTLYRVDNVRPEQNGIIEERRPVINLVLPTASLLSFVEFFLNNVASQQGIDPALQEYRENLKAVSREQTTAALLEATKPPKLDE